MSGRPGTVSSNPFGWIRAKRSDLLARSCFPKRVGYRYLSDRAIDFTHASSTRLSGAFHDVNRRGVFPGEVYPAFLRCGMRKHPGHLSGAIVGVGTERPGLLVPADGSALLKLCCHLGKYFRCIFQAPAQPLVRGHSGCTASLCAEALSCQYPPRPWLPLRKVEYVADGQIRRHEPVQSLADPKSTFRLEVYPCRGF